MNLLSLLKKDSDEAFDRIFRKYYPMLCAYAGRFVDAEEAENTVQEVMLWIWEHRMELTVDASFSQYLFKMTYHHALNVIAKKESSSRLETLFYMKFQQAASNADYYQIEELTRRIEKAIAALPESYREAFVMHRFRNKTYKEIAITLDVSPKTVDYRIQQALKILRKELKDYLPLVAFLLQG